MQRDGGPGGPGAGGNPTGATFTGPAEALEILGDHGYAYNSTGAEAPYAGLTTMLSFTTGNYYFVGEWTVCGAVNTSASSDTGAIDQFYLSYNGTTIQTLKTDTQQEDSPTLYTVPIIIPPYTEVVCQAASSLNNNSWVISQSIIGRIYRG